MTAFTFERIHIDEIAASDLLKEATNNAKSFAYRIQIDGHVEPATALYLIDEKRLGIASVGAFATWANVEGVDFHEAVESGIDMWLNDHATWEQAN